MNPPPPDPHQRSLSAELIFLAGEFLHHPVELREVIGLLRERAYTLLVFILALPFCLPVSVPGMSTPLGMMIAFITVAQARGRAPRLPERMLRYRLAPAFFRALLRASGRFVGFLERNLRPRWPWLTAAPTMLRLHYLMVVVAALTRAVPAPIPLSNTIPAWGILLGTAGVMQRDGLAVLAGYCFTAAGITYFALIGFLGVHAFDWFYAGWLGP